MPMKAKRYPRNWKELARACKERAGWLCEQCGIAHGTERIGRTRGNFYHVRLAAAHLDHDTENPNPRLMAMCEVCHIQYDRFLHGMNARSTHYRKLREAALQSGQLELPMKRRYTARKKA